MSAVEALQSCLAAEHAALYGYGVVGGVLAGTTGSTRLRVYADECYVAHRSRRDTITADIDRSGETPAAAEPAYELPFRVTGTASCTALARLIERRTAAVYASAVADTVDRLRVIAIAALTDCAIREVGWGAPLQALPGVGRT
ncbi:MAG: ferritin-like domain-containing protein [Lapillicoccus sp.]